MLLLNTKLPLTATKKSQLQQVFILQKKLWQWFLLRWVLLQLWDKWPKCLSEKKTGTNQLLPRDAPCESISVLFCFILIHGIWTLSPRQTSK